MFSLITKKSEPLARLSIINQCKEEDDAKYLQPFVNKVRNKAHSYEKHIIGIE